ncbi:MAG: hypothetical protein ABI325_01190 [Ginsengibacter sp.]
MQRLLRFIFICFSFVLLNSCSKKHHPSRSTAATEKPSPDLKKTEDAVVAPKEVSKPKVSFPKVITVNDNVAHKSVDGRLYYDVQGHRYWRNNKDGKYYLFNKSMYNNPDFQNQK